jgi:hypothetical protein
VPAGDTVASGQVVLPPRSAADAEAQLDEARERLVANIDSLKDYVRPKNVMTREVNRVKSIFVDEHGGVRIERVAGGVALVVGVAVVASLLRRRRR